MLLCAFSFMIASVIAFLGFFGVAQFLFSEAIVITCLCISALGVCTISVLAEALIVEKVARDNLSVSASKRLSAILMSFYWIAHASARMIAGGK